MKQIALTLFTVSTLLFSCKNSDEKEKITTDGMTTKDTTVSKDEAWVPVDSATAMKAWMEYGTPGSVQQMMASWNGTWIGEMSNWQTAGGEPMKSTTTSVNTTILGGRYQMSKNTGSFGGMPFEGISTTGYDNAKKVFVSSWVDNMGTGIMYLSGPWDEATKTMTLTGTQTDPTRGKDCAVRETVQIIDDNTQLLSMYGPDPMTGKEMKMMEIKMTRKK